MQFGWNFLGTPHSNHQHDRLKEAFIINKWTMKVNDMWCDHGHLSTWSNTDFFPSSAQCWSSSTCCLPDSRTNFINERMDSSARFCYFFAEPWMDPWTPIHLIKLSIFPGWQGVLKYLIIFLFDRYSDLITNFYLMLRSTAAVVVVVHWPHTTVSAVWVGKSKEYNLCAPPDYNGDHHSRFLLRASTKQHRVIRSFTT